jgi:glucose-1-phosphate thymidylyltransferase
MQASSFVQAVEGRQGMMIASPQEVAYCMGFTEREQLLKLSSQLGNSYGSYLRCLLEMGFDRQSTR